MIRKRGATVIFVPCWWDGSHGSLAATLLFERPDLFSNMEEFYNKHYSPSDLDGEEEEANPGDHLPITLNPAYKYFNVGFVPDVGELMQASFPGNTANYVLDAFNPWWLGEKYDGVRCCWNHIKQTVYTRPGREIPLHNKLWESLLPIKEFLDCEFWLGRGNFAEVQNILSTPTGNNIAFARMITFDNPDPRIHLYPFEDRYKSFLSHISSEHPFVVSQKQ